MWGGGVSDIAEGYEHGRGGGRGTGGPCVKETMRVPPNEKGNRQAQHEATLGRLARCRGAKGG